MQLCWLTCAASRLNGEELSRSGGVALLGGLLGRCVGVLPLDAAPGLPAAQIATQALRALAVMAGFPAARAELAVAPGLVPDVARCAGLQRAPAAVDAALSCVAAMCASPELQAQLLRAGVLGWVVPLLLAYDASHASHRAAAGDGDAGDGADGKVEAGALLPHVFDPARGGGPGHPTEADTGDMQVVQGAGAPMVGERRLCALLR